jgi:hypothetical protein
MSESEKRQSANPTGATMRNNERAELDECPMTADTFMLERIETPTGPMRIVSDDEGRLRAVDWEDCTPRLQELLRHSTARGQEPVGRCAFAARLFRG